MLVLLVRTLEPPEKASWEVKVVISRRSRSSEPQEALLHPGQCLSMACARPWARISYMPGYKEAHGLRLP